MICKISGEQFEATPTGLRICEKFCFPAPEISPTESFRRLTAQRNFFNLYKSNCAMTGKSIITNVPPGSPVKVYQKDAWFGDGWDALEYGRAADFSQPFLPQLGRLMREVPVFNLQNVNTENCDYCNSIADAKDCYLSFVCYLGCSDIYYSFRSFGSRDIYFCVNSDASELNYYCGWIKRCYGNICCEYCSGTQNCAFCFGLDNCRDCLFSSNLRNRQYCIFNEQKTRSEYQAFREQLNLGSSRALHEAMKVFEEVKLKAVWRASHEVNCDDCVGTQLMDSSRCYNLSDGWRCEFVDDSIQATDDREGYRTFGNGRCELFYESTGHTRVTTTSFSTVLWDSYDCHYCTHLQNCKHCFGCVGLRNKSHCILNKQYNPEEFDVLRNYILDHMKRMPLEDRSFRVPTVEFGQFLPARFSYYPYNISLAQIFWPLSREQALDRGYGWFEDEAEPSQYMQNGATPPDLIDDWSAEPSKGTVICPKTGKAYAHPPRLIKHFQKQNLALLPEHPLEQLKRKVGRISYRLLNRRSAKSGVPLLTVYSPETAPVIWTNEEYSAQFI